MAENNLDEDLLNSKVKVSHNDNCKRNSVSTNEVKIPFYFSWKDVNFHIQLSDSLKTNKKILSDVSGYTKSSEITAIMGPSGSGKTSLLNILSNRISYPKNSTHSSTFYINNQQVSKTFYE